MACPASPLHYQYNGIKTLKTSVLGTLNMCGLAKRCSAKLLFASTSEVYGDPLEHPQKEEYFGNVNSVGIRSCYDEGKRAAETICTDYRRQHGLDIRIARIFNTYGPRMSFEDGRVVSNFVFQALSSKELTVYGDGSQTRSFCYVSDLVEGLVALMNCPHKFDVPVNLGNPNEFTVLELAHAVQNEVNCSGISFAPLPGDDPRRRRPDITRARTMLGWEPKIQLQEGLRMTVCDFVSRIYLFALFFIFFQFKNGFGSG